MSSDRFTRSQHQSGDRSGRKVGHPGRLLAVEESVLCAVIVAAALVTLFASLPKPSAAVAAVRSLQGLKSPFAGPRSEPTVALVPASRPMMAAIRRAERLERAGRFDEATRDAWRAAASEAHRLAFLPISTGPGTYVRLFMKEGEEGRMTAIANLLEELLPGRFAALQARRDAAIAADPDVATSFPEVTWFMVVDDAPDEVRRTAYDLCALHEDARRNAEVIAKYREIIGYDHWRAVCDAGASEPGFLARAALWRAEFDASQSQFDLAKAMFEQGFDAWREACGVVPALDMDDRVAEEMAEHQGRYREVLALLEAAVGAEQTTLEL